MLQFILRKGLWEIGFLGRSSTSDIKTVTTTMIATPKDNQSLKLICKGNFAQWPVCKGWSFCAGKNRVASEAATWSHLWTLSVYELEASATFVKSSKKKLPRQCLFWLWWWCYYDNDFDDDSSDKVSIEYLELDLTFAMNPPPGVATNLW